MPLSKEVCLVVHSSVREFSCVCLSLRGLGCTDASL